MIDDCVETGRLTAKVHYGARGWVLHHNTDLWRGTAPINNVEPRHLADRRRLADQHLWARYLYSRDKDFLRSRPTRCS
jgi:alpha-L-fucosidase 2